MQRKRTLVAKIRQAAKDYLTHFEDCGESEQVTWTRQSYKELRTAMAELCKLDPQRQVRVRNT